MTNILQPDVGTKQICNHTIWQNFSSSSSKSGHHLNIDLMVGFWCEIVVFLKISEKNLFPHLSPSASRSDQCVVLSLVGVLFCISKRPGKNDQHDHHFLHIVSNYVLIWLLLWSVVIGGGILFCISKRAGKNHQHDHHFLYIATILIWPLLLWSVVGGRSGR